LVISARRRRSRVGPARSPIVTAIVGRDGAAERCASCVRDGRQVALAEAAAKVARAVRVERRGRAVIDARDTRRPRGRGGAASRRSVGSREPAGVRRVLHCSFTVLDERC